MCIADKINLLCIVKYTGPIWHVPGTFKFPCICWVIIMCISEDLIWYFLSFKMLILSTVFTISRTRGRCSTIHFVENLQNVLMLLLISSWACLFLIFDISYVNNMIWYALLLQLFTIFFLFLMILSGIAKGVDFNLVCLRVFVCLFV